MPPLRLARRHHSRRNPPTGIGLSRPIRVPLRSGITNLQLSTTIEMESVEDMTSPDGYTRNFAPAVEAGGLLFVSGQAAVNKQGRLIVGGLREHMELAMSNLSAVLAEHGCTRADVVRVGCYVQNPADLPEYNELYRHYFDEPLPARTTLTSCLTNEVLFEIDVVATVDASRTASAGA